MNQIIYYYLANSAINPFGFCTKDRAAADSFIQHMRAYAHPNAYQQLAGELKMLKVPEFFFYTPTCMRLNDIQQALNPFGLIIKETYEVRTRDTHESDPHEHLNKLTTPHKGFYHADYWKEWEEWYKEYEGRRFLEYASPSTETKVALVYTATGPEYLEMAASMCESARRHFCRDVKMDTVPVSNAEHMPWPLPALLKWNRLLSLFPRLEENGYTHVFMIDADMEFVEDVPFSEVSGPLSVVHHGSIWGKAKNDAYPNPFDQKLCQYLTSAFVGGQIATMKSLVRKCAEEVEEALLRNSILPYHDETALNTVIGKLAYVSPWEFMHQVRRLPEAYCYFQNGCKNYGESYERTCGPAKIVTLDKSSIFGETEEGHLHRRNCYHHDE